MPHDGKTARTLSDAQIRQFIRDGYVRIDGAFPRHMGEAAQAILWRDLGCDRNDRKTWTEPVIRLGRYTQSVFIDAANTPVLHAAFDQLVGATRWQPCSAMGTFPVRFPSADDPGDTGWHIDVSFDDHKTDFMEWRANVSSKGRALLMLFLFSDIAADDAPTRIRIGSHRHVARALAPAGEQGLTMRELLGCFAETAECPEVQAIGEIGTVYLCHPFLVHAAQLHRGQHPRFLAQPPLLQSKPLSLDRFDGDYSAVELAIRDALNGS